MICRKYGLLAAALLIWAISLNALPPVFIEVSGSRAVYRITGNDFLAAGVPIAAYDTGRMELMNGSTAVPLLISDGGDGRIDEADSLWFVGTPYKDAYTKVNVYRLTDTSGSVSRMGALDLTPAGGTDRTANGFDQVYVFDDDVLYNTLIPQTGDADHFSMWSFSSASMTRTFPVAMGDLIDTDGSITVHFHGLTEYAAANPDHHAEIYLNNTLLGDVWFDGVVPYSASVNFTSTELLVAGNDVRIDAPQGIAGVANDAFVLDRIIITAKTNFTAAADVLDFNVPQAGYYQISGFSSDQVYVFDLTAGVNVVNGAFIAGGTVSLEAGQARDLIAVEDAALSLPAAIYAVPDVDLQALPTCDYLVLTSKDQKTAAQELANVHPDLTVQVVDLTAVFDQFGNGRFGPQPIKDYLTWLWNNNKAPRYVVLAGDCAYDRTGTVPTYYFYETLNGAVASDNWMVCVSGADAIPEMALGRIPSGDAAELADYIQKVKDYLTLAPQGAWEEQVLFVADDDDGVVEDQIFPVYNSELAALVPGGYNKVMANLGNFPSDIACHDAVVQKLEEGVLIAEYFGHGTLQLWTNEAIFTNADAEALTATNFRYPFFMSNACMDGLFIEWHPLLECLTEKLIFNPTGGGIGMLSATSLAAADDKYPLVRGMYESIFEDDIRIVGDALLASKAKYTAANASQHDMVLHTHNLTGDPALELRVPSPRKPIITGAEDSGSAILLSWTTSDTNITEFEVYRSSGGGFYELVGTVGGSSLAYADATVSDDTDYVYTIIARNDRGLYSVAADDMPASMDEPEKGGCMPGRGGASGTMLLLILTGLSGLVRINHVRPGNPKP